MYGLQLGVVNLFSQHLNASISRGTNVGTNTNTNLSVQKPRCSGSATGLFIYINFQQTDFNNLQFHKFTVKAAVPKSHINTYIANVGIKTGHLNYDSASRLGASWCYDVNLRSYVHVRTITSIPADLELLKSMAN
jgi:hypothetical protein